MNVFSSPYFLKQLKIAFEIIDDFSFNEPFHLFLKKKFQQHKNWGSKDRKNYRSICYTILRNYPLFKNLSPEECINQFISISNGSSTFKAFDELINIIDPNINLEWVNQSFNQISPVFFVPYSKINFSKGSPIDFSNLPGFIGCLQNTESLIFDGSSNLESLVVNKIGYIQDYSSSIAIKSISEYCNSAVVWDACSASGGKSLSIQKYSIPKKHFCSDIRPEIIKNLEKRFQLSPYPKPETAVFDARKDHYSLFEFNLGKNIIIADLPCSGSGNWRRNPENRWTFNEVILAKYQELQRSIFTSLYKKLPVGGYIYYMTCSIFKAENQDNINLLKQENPGMQVLLQEYYGGKLNEFEGLFSDYIFGCLIEKTQ